MNFIALFACVVDIAKKLVCAVGRISTDRFEIYAHCECPLHLGVIGP